MIAVTIDTHELGKLTRAAEKIKADVPKVIKPVVASTLLFGMQAIKKAIQAQYFIQTGDIHTSVKLKDGGMSGSIELTGGMLRLTNFPHHPASAPHGVMPALMFAQVKKGGGGVMPGGFMTSSGDGIFIRSGHAPRLPINKLWTIGAPIMAAQPAVGPVANKETGDELNRQCDIAMKRVLGSGG